LVSIGLVLSEEKIFEKAYDVRRTPSDGNSSPDPSVHQPTWPLLLKIEHMVKLQVFGNNSKTVNNIKNLTRGKNDQHSKIYIPCNFEVNPLVFPGQP
jgi:hypothetical protein